MKRRPLIDGVIAVTSLFSAGIASERGLRGWTLILAALGCFFLALVTTQATKAR